MMEYSVVATDFFFESLLLNSDHVPLGSVSAKLIQIHSDYIDVLLSPRQARIFGFLRLLLQR